MDALAQMLATQDTASSMVYALSDCNALTAQVLQWLYNETTPAEMADAVAAMEVSCAALRNVVGSHLVDLAKVEMMAGVQQGTLRRSLG